VGLRLEALEVTGPVQWRWLLSDESSGRALVDHRVRIDQDTWEYEAFTDVYRYLYWNAAPDRRAVSEADILARLGAWIGSEVLGERIGHMIAQAATTVRVVVPAEAEFLSFLPLELARIEGASLATRKDVGFVYEIQGTSPGAKTPVGAALRMLAIFSLPTQTTALGLRRERYELTRLIRRLSARYRRRVELSVLQYGATRERLSDLAEDGEGWDVLHLSGHGAAGEFLLEKLNGTPDPTEAADLAQLLRPTRSRVKLAVVSACESAAMTTADTLRILGLEEAAQQVNELRDDPTQAPTTGLARALIRAMGCAVVAMRYPVTDAFAISFADQIYEQMFRHGQPPEIAMPRARVGAFNMTPAAPELSIATPVLFTTAGSSLNLAAPRGEIIIDSDTVPMAYFPPEPERFVGRAEAMAKASAALAPDSGRSAVVLHGMAGAGKTACAVELAYRHQDSFSAHAFWQAPQADDDLGAALANLAVSLETQLPGFTMVDKIATVEMFEAFLPRLTRLLEQVGLLLVLDNLETLLTEHGEWRDPRWKPLIASLTRHRGESRTILTTRTSPVGLDPNATEVLAVHALSRDETVLLARELPHLSQLMHADAGPVRDVGATAANRNLVRRTLAIVQGHPKLLELADATAENPSALEKQLTAAEAQVSQHGTALASFFTTGISPLSAEGFLGILSQWTVATLNALPEAATLMARFLACMEENDRQISVVEANWSDLWRRLERTGEPPDSALPLAVVARTALVEPHEHRLSLHPGVAEAIRADTDEITRAAVDNELAAFWRALAHRAQRREDAEHTPMIVRAGLAAAPYLLRLRDWNTADYLLEQSTLRDDSPRTVEMALPYLRRIVDATGKPQHISTLANVLRTVDHNESESLLRNALEQMAAARNHGGASAVAGYLVILLRDTGRLNEALIMVERKARHTRQAGMGPWTQLADQVWRLQILGLMGQHEQVLSELPGLLMRMDELPEPPADNDKTIHTWSVRETALDTGNTSALDLEQWEYALALNAEIIVSARRRAAADLEIASDRFNDYGPLLRLGRFSEADQLLQECQQTFQRYDDIAGLARVFGARADLEFARRRPQAAITALRTALRLDYIRPDLHTTAAHHHNLAVSLQSVRSDPAEQRAHRLAAALIYMLAGMKHNLVESIRDMAAELRAGDKPANMPSTLAKVTELVELTDGVRFGHLIATLVPAPEQAEAALTQILTAVRLSQVRIP
jgi:tetratricopeptide (TPR) repeat protein